MWLAAAAAGYTCTKRFDLEENKMPVEGKPLLSTRTNWPFHRERV